MTDNLKKQLEKTGVKSIGILTKNLAENNKYWTGDLIRSLSYEIVRIGEDSWDLRLLALDYFKYVNEQSKSYPKPVRPRLMGGPPIDALDDLEQQLGLEQIDLIVEAAQLDIEEKLINSGLNIIGKVNFQ